MKIKGERFLTENFHINVAKRGGFVCSVGFR